jgi:hypothetical protein
MVLAWVHIARVVEATRCSSLSHPSLFVLLQLKYVHFPNAKPQTSTRSIKSAAMFGNFALPVLRPVSACVGRGLDIRPAIPASRSTA